MLLLDNLDVPVSPIDYEDYNGFSEAYQYSEEKNFDFYTRTLNVLMSGITLVLSSFSVFVIGSTGKMNRVYQRTIIEHIIMSTVLSFIFPVTGFTIIANYRILMIDRWLDSAKLPLITAAIIVYGYLGVVVFCMYSFFMNFLASVHVRVNSRILRKWDPEFVLRVLIILYGIAISILLWIFAFKSFYWNSESIMNDLKKIHPQYSHVNLEKTVHTLVWTQGLSYILMVLACICLSFVPFSISIISWNYVLVNNQKSKHSEVVKKQQRLTIKMEILYLIMIFTCYIPSFVTLLCSIVLQNLPESMKKCPITLFVSFPLQLLPILDCLLNLFMVTMYREKAYQVIKTLIVYLPFGNRD